MEVTFIKYSLFFAYQLEISDYVSHSPTRDAVSEMNEKTTLVYEIGHRKYSVLPFSQHGRRDLHQTQIGETTQTLMGAEPDPHKLSPYPLPGEGGRP